MGGTWDLFRYPGIRSDSDMFTLGYSFRPWEEAKAIADGPAIRKYITRRAEYGIEDKIRYGHKVVRAEWSTTSRAGRWTPSARTRAKPCSSRAASSSRARAITTTPSPTRPSFAGIERFEGEIIHPQHWPEDLDYDGKRVVVVGSGATAVTIVPAMAERAEHVTMLQRSPSYIVSLPAEDRSQVRDARVPEAVRLRVPAVEERAAHPGELPPQPPRAEGHAQALPQGVERHLPPGLGLDPHFTPRYGPWTQRVCLVPDGDLFEALAPARRRSSPTGSRRSPRTGLRLASGAELEADIIVTATGLNLLVMGGMRSRSTARTSTSRDGRLQGHDVQRRPEPRDRARLHERVVDAEVRPDLRVRVPPHQPHGRARLRPVHAAAARTRRWRSSRSST